MQKGLPGATLASPPTQSINHEEHEEKLYGDDILM
jgi:hypothetical protein